MSKFLIISEGGDGIGLAMRLHAEGNEVRIWIRETEAEKRGTGLVEHAKDNSFGECVIADCTGAGPLLDHIRDNNHRVFGGSALADRLESDREFATQVMEQAGIKTPKSKSFTDWDTAEEFIKVAEERLVFKPEGSLSGIVPSYCPSDNEELLGSIEYFKTLIGPTKPEFTLQEFIEGTCVSTEGWFDGRKFIRPFNHTIERKHLMAGDIGPSGGCVGNIVWPVGDECPIVQATVLRLEEFLATHEYRGAIDVNAVVNDEGCYALEFTPRFGYDAFPTFLYSLYTGDFGSFIWSCCEGNAPDFMDVADRFGAGIRLSQPPWPTEKYDAEAGVPIRGLKQADLVDFFYPYEVSENDGRLTTSGGVGVVGVCKGSPNPGAQPVVLLAEREYVVHGLCGNI